MAATKDNKAIKNKLVKPFLKWAGGKSQILSKIGKYLPEKYSSYYEPFVGGGALLFYWQPKKAVINDSNEELINVYKVIRDSLDELIVDLEHHVNSEGYFYQIRSWDRDEKHYANLSPIKKASRIIYLNKTCFNGLFRVNRAGQFNSPFGNYRNPNIVDEPVLRAVSKYLNHANIRINCGDFEEGLQHIRKGAFVYIDPPYDPVSDSANFTGYDKGGFDRNEQERLKEVCDKINRKGIKFLLSNSATDFIKYLYRDYNYEIISARRAINSIPNKRGEVDEILVRNYE